MDSSPGGTWSRRFQGGSYSVASVQGMKGGKQHTCGLRGWTAAIGAAQHSHAGSQAKCLDHVSLREIPQWMHVPNGESPAAWMHAATGKGRSDGCHKLLKSQLSRVMLVPAHVSSEFAAKAAPALFVVLLLGAPMGALFHLLLQDGVFA